MQPNRKYGDYRDTENLINELKLVEDFNERSAFHRSQRQYLESVKFGHIFSPETGRRICGMTKMSYTYRLPNYDEYYCLHHLCPRRASEVKQEDIAFYDFI